MQDLWRLSATELAALIKSKKVSAREAATAAPAPPDEPPGVRPGSLGFLVSPWIRLVVNQR